MDPNKKISFGFNKSRKKSVVIRNKSEERKVELVECFENKSVKIKDAIQVVNEPLVIPIKENKKNLFDRVKAAKAKQGVLIKNNLRQEDDTRPDSELTAEELAARELINDAKNHLSNKSSNKMFVLPIKVDKITLEGEKEPTLDDYENVPVTDYGMAMLRGMGWKEGMGIGKKPTKSAATYEPELRPKGLGLGASRMVKADIPNETACDKDGNDIILKRGTCAKIIAGSHKGNYCEVEGLDDEAGRVIVRTSLKGELLNLNEFLIVPVTKEEYSKGSKILNNARYEEYKEISDKKLGNHWEEKKETTDNHKGAPESISSRIQLKENQISQDDDEQSIRSSSYSKEYLISEENKRYERKKYNNEGKNDKYDKVEKHSNSTHKDKYEHRSRSSRDRKKYSSESGSDNEIKNRRDKERKSYYRGESSKSHKDKYKKKSSKNKHTSRSSSSDNKKRDIKNK